MGVLLIGVPRFGSVGRSPLLFVIVPAVSNYMPKLFAISALQFAKMATLIGRMIGLFTIVTIHG